MASRHTTGAVAVGGADTHRRPAWLKWLLPLLVLAALIALLVALLGGDDDSSTSGSGGAANGSLTVQGNDLLPASDDTFTSIAGEEAVARRVEVVKVNPQEGFWVGTSETERSYVEW